MKVFGLVLSFLILAGCGGWVPMEELEQQALLTGDWSAVEKRERAIERRKQRHGPSCGRGQLALCEVSIAKERCQCVAADSLRTTITWD